MESSMECWAALDQWCLRRLLSIKWYQFVSNAEVRQTTSQSLLTSTVQSRRLSLFRHIALMDDNMDAQKILFTVLPESLKRLPGRPRITWLDYTEWREIPQPHTSEALAIAQNHPVWKLLATFSTTHSSGASQQTDDDDIAVVSKALGTTWSNLQPVDCKSNAIMPPTSPIVCK